MIFICFLLIVSIFLISAFFAGNISTFINFDSMLIVFLGSVISSLSVSLGRKTILLIGIKQMFELKLYSNRNIETGNMFKTISIMTIATGVCSTAQGLITSSLINLTEYSTKQIFSYASFTTIYSIILVSFLFVPIIYINSENSTSALMQYYINFK